MLELEDVKVRTKSYVDGSITSSDFSDWLALNFWDGDTPDLIHHAKHLLYDLDAGLIDEAKVKDDLALEVGRSRVETGALVSAAVSFSLGAGVVVNEPQWPAPAMRPTLDPASTSIS